MNIKYRSNVTNKDIPQLNALLSSHGGHRTVDTWQCILKVSAYIITAEIDGKIVGMGRFVDDGAMCMVYDIMVSPKHQRKGIASQIMKQLTSQINPKERVFVGLFISEQSPALKDFYKNFGFKPVSTGMRM